MIYVHSTLNALVNQLKQEVDQFDVVSFDVFDTLFIRPVHDPDIIKKATAKYIESLAKTMNVWADLRSIEQCRDKIEADHRLINGAKNPDYEANYDQFMPEVLKALFADKYDPSIFNQVADYEIMVESEMLIERTQIIELIEFLHKKKKKLLLLSDMYLPAQRLRKIIESKNLAGYFIDIISSADSFRAKASGTAFPLVQQKHGLDIKRWAHIGDNRHSDGHKPDEYGLTAYVLEDRDERHRKGLVARYHHYSQLRNFWKGRYIQQIMLPLQGQNISHDALYQDGYNCFSYLFGYAIMQLKNRVQACQVSKIYFCSREGWLFKQCWEQIAPILWPELAKSVQIHYLYVSRLALAKASRANVGLTIEDTNIAFGPTQNKDFNDLIRVFGLNKKTVAPFLKQVKLGFDEVISPLGRTGESYSKLLKILNNKKFNEAIKADAESDQKALESYLESLGFFDDEQVAVVDIGWLGTIQHYLVKAVEHRQDKPCINGFMLAADRQYEYPSTDKSRYEGLVYDRLKFRFVPSLLTSFKDVLEEICRANHPTLLAYQQQKEGPPLLFRSNKDQTAKAEKQQFEYYSPLHQGIFDGVRRFALAMAVHDFSLLQIREWLDTLMVSKLAFASSSEITRLQNQSHQDDFVGQERVINPKLVKRYTQLWQLSGWRLRVPGVRWKLFRQAMRRLTRL